MQTIRTALEPPLKRRAVCLLDCVDCTGMCLALYMMLTRDEQDEMRRRHKAGAPVLH